MLILLVIVFELLYFPFGSFSSEFLSHRHLRLFLLYLRVENLHLMVKIELSGSTYLDLPLNIHLGGFKILLLLLWLRYCLVVSVFFLWLLGLLLLVFVVQSIDL